MWRPAAPSLTPVTALPGQLCGYLPRKWRRKHRLYALQCPLRQRRGLGYPGGDHRRRGEHTGISRPPPPSEKGGGDSINETRETGGSGGRGGDYAACQTAGGMNKTGQGDRGNAGRARSAGEERTQARRQRANTCKGGGVCGGWHRPGCRPSCRTSRQRRRSRRKWSPCAVQLAVHFLEGPAQVLGVLAHLQAGGGHAAGVGSLAGAEAGRHSWMAAMASGVQGMLAPSKTPMQPFLIRALAEASSSSFWVAQGRAMSQGTRSRCRSSPPHTWRRAHTPDRS